MTTASPAAEGVPQWDALLARVVEVEADECRMAPHVETALSRIAQEALQNVTKHAGASRVHVRLREGQDGVQLVVTDDGRGFDAERLTASRAREAGGYGMASIHERAALVGARVAIESRPGQGTTVTVSGPYRFARSVKEAVGREPCQPPDYSAFAFQPEHGARGDDYLAVALPYLPVAGPTILLPDLLPDGPA